MAHYLPDDFDEQLCKHQLDDGSYDHQGFIFRIIELDESPYVKILCDLDKYRYTDFEFRLEECVRWENNCSVRLCDINSTRYMNVYQSGYYSHPYASDEEFDE